MIRTRQRPPGKQISSARIDCRIECDASPSVDGHPVHAFTDAAGRVIRPSRDVQESCSRLTAAHGG